MISLHLDTPLTSCTYTSTTGSATVTINKAAHGLEVGDYINLFCSNNSREHLQQVIHQQILQLTFLKLNQFQTSGTFTVTMPIK
jgi:hypothetical protein